MGLKSINKVSTTQTIKSNSNKSSDERKLKTYRLPVELIERMEEFRFTHRYNSLTDLLIDSLNEFMKQKGGDK